MTGPSSTVRGPAGASSVARGVPESQWAGGQRYVDPACPCVGAPKHQIEDAAIAFDPLGKRHALALDTSCVYAIAHFVDNLRVGGQGGS